jgi:CRP-like cAMP-binding protein
MTDIRPEALAAHSKLFALLDDAGHKRLCAVAVEEDVPVEHTVLKEGDFGDAFFFLVDGEMSREVARLKTGAFFGEIAALLGEARSATVVATTPSRLLRFDVPRVQAILTDYPRVREVLVKLGLRRSEANLEQMMDEPMVAAATVSGEADAQSTPPERSLHGDDG